LALQVDLDDADFTNSLYGKVFAKMLQLARQNERFDIFLLSHALGNSFLADEVERLRFLNTLIDNALPLPTLAYVAEYARKIKNETHKRGLIYLGERLAEQGRSSNGDALDLDLVQFEVAQFIENNQPAATWKNQFHSVDQLKEGGVIFLIDKILPPGITFIGGKSGTGKTWFALSMSRALIHGRKLLNVFNVPAPQNILYFCPEMNERAFKRRCEKLEIGGDRFRCMTLSDGAAIDLADPVLLAAIRELKPVIFLDTAIRFSTAENENSSSENQVLARSLFALLQAGAVAVVCLHHRSKNNESEELTLENTLAVPASSARSLIASSGFNMIRTRP
jgi:hypothetical protein